MHIFLLFCNICRSWKLYISWKVRESAFSLCSLIVFFFPDIPFSLQKLYLTKTTCNMFSLTKVSFSCCSKKVSNKTRTVANLTQESSATHSLRFINFKSSRIDKGLSSFLAVVFSILLHIPFV